MESGVPTFSPFSSGRIPATAKLLVLGSASVPLVDRSRSLNIEHVSAAELSRQEISRHTPAGRLTAQARKRGQPPPDSATLAALRRWFWTRKPDAGFVLSDFPATLLQAHVFDEWLDARGSALTAVVVSDPVPPGGTHAAILDHYRTLGVDRIDAGTFSVV